MTLAALIVAAGRGLRAGGGDTPKQFQMIGGEPVLSHTLKVFAQHGAFTTIAVVIHPDFEPLVKTTILPGITTEFPDVNIILVNGGDTRQQSVFRGLEVLESVAPDRVLIHDAARPFVDTALCDRVIDATDTHEGAIPALAVADTLKRIAKYAGDPPTSKAAASSTIETVDRSGLYGAQTPQGFRFDGIYQAHIAAAQSGKDDFTDDASIAEWRGLSLAIVEGHRLNQKITTPDDLNAADHHLKCEALLADNPGQQFEYRTGSGFDVHRFGEGNKVILCGVEIAHSRGLKGHSDADVGLHALTDAVLGAIGAGDIGTHFPPSDARWKGAASDQFLAHAKELVTERRGKLIHVDVTLICEAPKIGPHRDAMTARLSDILGITTDRISIKATTTEGLGFAGRGEGIAAMASATVALPMDPIDL